ncbi:hypothetical protein NL676_023486 [Syzygium grande]|nr:hypothetical protein NL676_023486 [Syzygium grande]
MKKQTARRPRHEYRIRVEEDGHRRRRFSDSTLHRDPRYGVVAAKSPVHHDGGMISFSSPNRLVWQNPWVEHIKSSTHRTQYLASVGGGGGQMSSPKWEKSLITARPFLNSEIGMRQTLPLADVYTDVFDRVVEEKKGAAEQRPKDYNRGPSFRGPSLQRSASSVDTRSKVCDSFTVALC